MTTRSKLIVGAVALVLLAAPVDQSFAGPIGDTGSFWQSRQANRYDPAYGGGEFTVFSYSGLDNAGYTAASSNIGTLDPSFQTFCLEAGEFTHNPSYFVIGSAAVQGGTGASDPLSEGTAWLYSQFAGGALTGYTYGTGSSARQLQEAIWWFEGEAGGSTNAFTALAIANVTNATSEAAAGYLGVYALINFDTAAHRDAFILTGATDGRQQDFLYTTVPDGGTTLMLLGGALMGLGALRRKFNA